MVFLNGDARFIAVGILMSNRLFAVACQYKTHLRIKRISRKVEKWITTRSN